MAESSVPIRLQHCTQKTNASSRERERVVQGMARAMMAKVNAFLCRSLTQRLNFQVVDPWLGDRSG